ncbi:MAG: TlpA family protein disulfide reductase [Alphaproteobacteria bacterium]|nr:TlpA family protein disulfide reductase [Alphaproteobacteria bacterium]
MQRRFFVGSAAALAFAGRALAAVPQKLKPGMTVPDFARPGLDGKPVELARYKGKVILVDFWASWCAPCVIAIPHFRAWQTQWGGRGFQVIGISMDDSSDDARAAAVRLKVNYPVVMGDARLGERFGGILGLPVEMLVGRDGRILQIWQGDTPPATIEKAVRAALA